MKILFVLEHFHPYIGGVETLFAALGKSLADQGHEVKVITSRFDRQLPASERWQDILIERIPVSNRFTFTFLGAYWVWKHSSGFDLLHTTSYNAAVPAWLAAKLRRKPVLITFHEVWGKLWYQVPWLTGFQRFIFNRYEQLLLRLPFQQYVAVSHATGNALREAGIPPDRIQVIHNGIDYQQFERYRQIRKQRDNQPFTIMYYGRLGVSKGLDFVFRMLKNSEIGQLPIRWRLVLAKRPKALYRRIFPTLQHLSQQPNVEVYHHLPAAQLFQRLAESDAVLIPSYSEGFCFVAAEAMAVGVPIIHSDRGALNEVVSGSHLIIPKLTESEGMVEVLKQAIEGDWDQRPPRRFPLLTTIREYESLYQEMLQNGKQKTRP